MGIDPCKLGPAAKKQIADKLMRDSRSQAAGIAVDGRNGASKYHNTPAERETDSGQILRFASKKEAARYDELMLMLKSGKIRNLKLQPEYTLQEAYTTPDGKRVKAIRYRADFNYKRKMSGYKPVNHNRLEATTSDDGKISFWEDIVEDAKGHRTDVYKMKKKMMLERHGIEIQEI